MKNEKQNLETAKMHWQDLQKFFAQGRLLLVDENLDLLVVAKAIAEDTVGLIKDLIEKNQVAYVNDLQAKKFFAENMIFWTTVVKPVILIQQIRAS